MSSDLYNTLQWEKAGSTGKSVRTIPKQALKLVRGTQFRAKTKSSRSKKGLLALKRGYIKRSLIY